MDPEMLAQMMSTYLMSPQGGGPGLWGDTFREQIKAMDSVDKSVMKVNEAMAPPTNAAGGAPMMPVSPTGLDSFVTAMNTPLGMAGMSSMLGKLGAAISAPNTWQSRLGTTAGGMGDNYIAGDRFNRVLSQLGTPPAPPAPTIATPPPIGGAPGATSNFLKASLTNPPQAMSLAPKAVDNRIPSIQEQWLLR